MEWLPLVSENQLDEVLKASSQKPVVLFKHSTRCSVSMMVKKTFERSWNQDKETIPVYYLDLLEYRPVSNKIAHDLNVEHQSPQVIVVKDGKAIYDASHDDIDAQEVLRQITQ